MLQTQPSWQRHLFKHAELLKVGDGTGYISSSFDVHTPRDSDTIKIRGRFFHTDRDKMRMLHSSAADEPEVEVTQADQANINRFSNLNVQYEELEAKVQAKKDELDYLSELETDLMMLDDDELVMYKLETSLVHMTSAKATELNERNQKKLSETVDRLQADLEKCDEEMNQLEKTLYQKFGNTINLERNDPA